MIQTNKQTQEHTDTHRTYVSNRNEMLKIILNAMKLVTFEK